MCTSKESHAQLVQYQMKALVLLTTSWMLMLVQVRWNQCSHRSQETEEDWSPTWSRHFPHGTNLNQRKFDRFCNMSSLILNNLKFFNMNNKLSTFTLISWNRFSYNSNSFENIFSGITPPPFPPYHHSKFNLVTAPMDDSLSYPNNSTNQFDAAGIFWSPGSGYK